MLQFLSGDQGLKHMISVWEVRNNNWDLGDHGIGDWRRPEQSFYLINALIIIKSWKNPVTKFI